MSGIDKIELLLKDAPEATVISGYPVKDFIAKANKNGYFHSYVYEEGERQRRVRFRSEQGDGFSREILANYRYWKDNSNSGSKPVNHITVLKLNPSNFPSMADMIETVLALDSDEFVVRCALVSRIDFAADLEALEAGRPLTFDVAAKTDHQSYFDSQSGKPMGIYWGCGKREIINIYERNLLEGKIGAKNFNFSSSVMRVERRVMRPTNIGREFNNSRCMYLEDMRALAADIIAGTHKPLASIIAGQMNFPDMNDLPPADIFKLGAMAESVRVGGYAMMRRAFSPRFLKSVKFLPYAPEHQPDTILAAALRDFL